jgi:hypothetical protein
VSFAVSSPEPDRSVEGISHLGLISASISLNLKVCYQSLVLLHNLLNWYLTGESISGRISPELVVRTHDGHNVTSGA